MKNLTPEDVTIDLILHPEHIPVRGNLIVSGDDTQDRIDEDAVLARLEYDLWAWCSVEVKATWTAKNGETFSGSEYLGGCSYSGEADFKTGGYYEGMVEAAIAELNSKLASTRAAVNPETAYAVIYWQGGITDIQSVHLTEAGAEKAWLEAWGVETVEEAERLEAVAIEALSDCWQVEICPLKE